MDSSKVKIVADSSSDLFNYDSVPYGYASLKIRTDIKEYTDNTSLDVKGMVDDLLKYSGKSSTTCPSPEDWLSAFGNAEYIFCISITSNLSGSYNSACIAKDLYEEKYIDRKVFVIDSLSTGPEMQIIINKIAELVKSDKNFETICDEITEYQKHTSLVFMLESMKNLANNGRVSPLTAKIAGVLGIRVVGKASDIGTLEVLEKCRGEKKAIQALFDNMKSMGYNGSVVKISHCFNPYAAQKLKSLINSEFIDAKVEIGTCGGLCSFYAEKGGMLIGFEH